MPTDTQPQPQPQPPHVRAKAAHFVAVGDDDDVNGANQHLSSSSVFADPEDDAVTPARSSGAALPFNDARPANDSCEAHAAGPGAEPPSSGGSFSCFLLEESNGFRRGCNFLVSRSTAYAVMMNIVIMLNSVLMVVHQPHLGAVDYSWYAEIAFLSIFSVDLLLRFVAKGVLLHPGAALREFWNLFRLLVILASLLSFFGVGINLSVFFVLLPLQVFSHSRSLRTISAAVALAMPMIAVSLLFLLLFLCLFALIGVDIWGEEATARRCVMRVLVPSPHFFASTHCAGAVGDLRRYCATQHFRSTFVDPALAHDGAGFADALWDALRGETSDISPVHMSNFTSATARADGGSIGALLSSLLRASGDERNLTRDSEAAEALLRFAWDPLLATHNASIAAACYQLLEAQSSNSSSSSSSSSSVETPPTPAFPQWRASTPAGAHAELLAMLDASPCVEVVIDDPFDDSMCGGMHPCAEPFECEALSDDENDDRITFSASVSPTFINPWRLRNGTNLTNHTFPTASVGAEVIDGVSYHDDAGAMAQEVLFHDSDRLIVGGGVLRSNRRHGSTRARQQYSRFDSFLRAALLVFSVVTRDQFVLDFDRFQQIHGYFTFPYFIFLSLIGRFFLLNTFLCVLLCEYAAASDAAKAAELREAEEEAAEEERAQSKNPNAGDGVKRLRVGSSVLDGLDPALNKHSVFGNDAEDQFHARLIDPAAPQLISLRIRRGVYLFLVNVVKPFNHFMTLLSLAVHIGFYHGIDPAVWGIMRYATLAGVAVVPVELFLRFVTMGVLLTVSNMYNLIDFAVVGNLAYEILYDVTTGISMLRGFRLLEGVYRYHRHVQLEKVREQLADEKRNARQVHVQMKSQGVAQSRGVTRLVAFDSKIFRSRHEQQSGMDATSLLGRPLAQGNAFVRVTMLFYSLVPAMSGLAKVMLAVTLLTYIYAIIGMQLFGGLKLKDAQNNDLRLSFRSLWEAGYLLFVVLMGEWSNIFFAVADQVHIAVAVAYFISFVLLNMFVATNMIASVVYNEFESIVSRDWAAELFFDREARAVVDRHPPRLILPPITYMDVIRRGGRASAPVRQRKASVGFHNVEVPSLAGVTTINWPQLVFRSEARQRDSKRPAVILQGYSLKIFGPTHPLRRAFRTLMFSAAFGIFTHVVTFFNLLLLALMSAPGVVSLLRSQTGMEEATVLSIFEISSYCFSAIFFTEVFIKVVVLGLYYPAGEPLPRDGSLPPGRSERRDLVYPAFARSGLNIVSVLVAVSSVLSIWFPVFRFGRSLRAVSFVVRFNGVRIAAMSLAGAVPYIFRVVVMGTIVWVILATIGVHIFAGKMHVCTDPRIDHKDDCVGHYYSDELQREAVARVLAEQRTQANTTSTTMDALLQFATGPLPVVQHFLMSSVTNATLHGFGAAFGPLDAFLANASSGMSTAVTINGSQWQVPANLADFESEAQRRLSFIRAQLDEADVNTLLVADALVRNRLYNMARIMRRWVRASPSFAFNHLGDGMLSMLIVSTGEGIQEFLLSCIDATAPNRASVPNANIFAGVYAVAVTLIGAFFVINAFVGVPYTYFMKFRRLLDGSVFLTEQQSVFYFSQTILETTMFLLDNAGKPTSRWRQGAFAIVSFVPQWLQDGKLGNPAAETSGSPAAIGGQPGKYIKSPPDAAAAPAQHHKAEAPVAIVTPKDDATIILGPLTLFDFFISIVVLLNSVVQLLFAFNVQSGVLSGPFMISFLTILSHTTTAIFAIEVVLKIIARGWRCYWAQPFNRFDLIVALLNFVDAVMDISGQEGRIFAALGVTGALYLRRFFSFADTLKLARVLKVIRRIKRVQKIFALMAYAIGPLLNVVVLYFVCLFIFSLLAVDLFGKVNPTGVMTADRGNNFETLPRAMLVLFQITTLDKWHEFMRACMVQEPDCSEAAGNCGNPLVAVPFFVIYSLGVGLFMIQLCVAVVVDTYWVLERLSGGRTKVFKIFDDLRKQWLPIALSDPDRSSVREVSCVSLCTFIRRIPAEYIETLNIVDLKERARRARTFDEVVQDLRKEGGNSCETHHRHRFEDAAEDAGRVVELTPVRALCPSSPGDSASKPLSPPMRSFEEAMMSPKLPRGLVSPTSPEHPTGATNLAGARDADSVHCEDYDVVLTNVDVLRIIDALHLAVVHKKGTNTAAANVATPPAGSSTTSQPGLATDSGTPCSFRVSFESVLFAMVRAWCRCQTPSRALCHLPVFAELTRHHDAFAVGGPGKQSGGVAYGGANMQDMMFTAAHVLAARFIWAGWMRFKRLRDTGRSAAPAPPPPPRRSSSSSSTSGVVGGAARKSSVVAVEDAYAGWAAPVSQEAQQVGGNNNVAADPLRGVVVGRDPQAALSADRKYSAVSMYGPGAGAAPHQLKGERQPTQEQQGVPGADQWWDLHPHSVNQESFPQQSTSSTDGRRGGKATLYSPLHIDSQHDALLVASDGRKSFTSHMAEKDARAALEQKRSIRQRALSGVDLRDI